MPALSVIALLRTRTATIQIAGARLALYSLPVIVRLPDLTRQQIHRVSNARLTLIGTNAARIARYIKAAALLQALQKLKEMRINK